MEFRILVCRAALAVLLDLNGPCFLGRQQVEQIFDELDPCPAAWDI